MKKIKLFVLFLVFAGLANAQNWTFKTYDKSNSAILSDVVKSLLLDKNNELWFGTDAGLGKFANNQWSKVTYSFSDVLNIGKFGDTIWVGTNNKGLWSVYNNQWKQYDLYTTGLGIIGCAKGKDGTLFRLDKFGKFTKLVGNSWVSLVNYVDHAAFLFCDSHKNIWVGSGNVGLYKYNNELVYQFKSNVAATSPNYIPASELKCMAEDTNGNLWVGTGDKGLLKYAGNQWLEVPTPSNAKVFDLDIDKNNKLWLVTDKGIMSYGNNEWSEFNTSNSALPGNWMDEILVENENKIWIATGYCGIVCMTQNTSGIHAAEKIKVAMYPNPAQNSVSIDFNNQRLTNVKISIANMMGKTLYSKDYKSIPSILQLDLSNYQAGFYLVDIRYGDTVIKEILIKNNETR